MARRNSVDVLAAAPFRRTPEGDCVPLLCALGPMYAHGMIMPAAPVETGVGPERLSGAMRELDRKD